MKRMKTWMGILAGGVLLLSGCDDVFETDLTGCPVRLLAPGDSVTTVVARQLFFVGTVGRGDGLPPADSDSGFLPARSLPVGYVGGGVPL